MHSRTLLNIALLALVIGLGLLVFYEPGIEAPEEKPKLTNLDPEAIQSVRIVRLGQEDIRVQRSGTQWRLLKPVAARADKFRMSALLRITAAQSYSNYPLSEVNAAQLGLDKPEVKLFLDDTELDFGKTEPINGRRYVRLGETVHLISDFAYYHLIGDYATFISPRLLPEGAKITALKLPEVSLRWQDEHWQVAPKPDRYSADQANRLVDAWRFATAMGVERYTADAGGEPVEVILGEHTIEFRIMAREPDFVIARPDLGVRYRFAGERSKDMLQLPAAGDNVEENTQR
jgi:hypothetical protein